MRALRSQWSRAFSLVCEVALNFAINTVFDNVPLFRSPHDPYLGALALGRAHSTSICKRIIHGLTTCIVVLALEKFIDHYTKKSFVANGGEKTCMCQ